MAQTGFKIGGSSPIDQLRYSYFTNSNRLQQVYDSADDVNSKLGDLHYDPATKATTDYTYDVNGSLIADKNKGIRSIHYNFLNLPDTISMTKTDGSSKGNIVYKYDAQGTKWAKIVTDSTVSPVRKTTTLYIKGFQYQNDTLQFVGHEEGRTRYLWLHFLNGDSIFRQRFDYFEKDHLGNTRVILTDQKDTSQYIATMEGAYRAKENALFYNIPQTAYSRTLAGYPVDLSLTNPNDSVIMLNGTTGRTQGPAIILKVLAGDTIDIAAKSYYTSQSGTGTTPSITDVLTSLASGVVGITDNEADALVAQRGELLRHARATLPVIGADAAISVGMLARRDAYEGNILTLENRGHRFQVGERRRENHAVDARLTNLSSDILGERGGVIVARLHHDLIFRRATPLDDSR